MWLTLLQVCGMPHRKSNHWMMPAAAGTVSFPCLVLPPEGKKIGRKHAILHSHGWGQGQPFCLGLYVSGHSEPHAVLAKWMNSAPTDLLAPRWHDAWLTSPSVRPFPASAPALLYKARTVTHLYITAKKNNYKSCVVWSSGWLLCKLCHSCTSILTMLLSATPWLSSEGRVDTQGKYWHLFSAFGWHGTCPKTVKTENFSTGGEWAWEKVSWAAKCWITAVDVSAKSNWRSPTACGCLPHMQTHTRAHAYVRTHTLTHTHDTPERSHPMPFISPAAELSA